MKNRARTERRGPGRPPKADELKMIERMDATAAPAKIWSLLWSKCEQGDTAALKLWLSYRYGQPRQMIEATVETKEPYRPTVIMAVTPDNIKEDGGGKPGPGHQAIKAVLPVGAKSLQEEE